MNRLLNERGFMLLHVVFLTLITSFAALILLNAAPRVKNPQSVLRLTAMHLANEQFAMLESMAATGGLATGSYSFQGDEDSLTSQNAGAGKSVQFEVTTTVDNGGGTLREVTVTVSWTSGGEDFELETERTIRVEEES